MLVKVFATGTPQAVVPDSTRKMFANKAVATDLVVPGSKKNKQFKMVFSYTAAL